MYFFTPDTIIQANKRIEDLDPKVGGLFCILSCLEEEIDEMVDATYLRWYAIKLFERDQRVTGYLKLDKEIIRNKNLLLAKK